MKKLREITEARKMDPVKLGQRAARRYGKSMDFPGQHYELFKQKEDEEGDLVPKKEKHIPLKKYDMDAADDVHSYLGDVQADLAPKKKKGYRDFGAGDKELDKYRTVETHKISDLHPTQPFVSTSREDLLSKKVTDKTQPIRTVTHNGKNYIVDGHHAVLGAALRGEKTVTTTHLDLDQFK